MSTIEFDKLTSLKLQFEGEPYHIKEASPGVLQPLAVSDLLSLSIGLGYIVYINDIAIMVNERGLYQINDLGDGEITSITFPIDSQVEIDYTAQLIVTSLVGGDEEETVNQIYTYVDVIGQITSAFDYNESVYDMIQEKYEYSLTGAQQRLVMIGGVQIEADEGTAFYIQLDSGENQRHVINDTQVLTLIDDNMRITNLYFSGLHLEESFDEREELEAENKFFTEVGKTYTSTAEIIYPEANHVYSMTDGTRYIYFRNVWYPMSEQNDIQTTVQAMVNYYCRVLREEYRTNE